jgi:hypothetical protein
MTTIVVMMVLIVVVALVALSMFSDEDGRASDRPGGHEADDAHLDDLLH